jgi:hypothetical protein
METAVKHFTIDGLDVEYNGIHFAATLANGELTTVPADRVNINGSCRYPSFGESMDTLLAKQSRALLDVLKVGDQVQLREDAIFNVFKLKAGAIGEIIYVGGSFFNLLIEDDLFECEVSVNKYKLEPINDLLNSGVPNSDGDPSSDSDDCVEF